MPLSASPPFRHVLPFARATARLTLASAGGYALAAAVAFLLARGLPMARAEAATAGSLAAIAAMPAAAVWVYGTPRLRHAAAGLIGLILVCFALAWAIGRPG